MRFPARLLGTVAAFVSLVALAACSATSVMPGEGGVGDGSVGADGIGSIGDGGLIAPDGSVIPGTDGGVGPTDSGVIVLPDGGHVPAAHVGTPCHTDAECPGLFCSPGGNGFGYCSWVCSPTMPCPDGSVCAVFTPGASYGYCMQRCDPSANNCASGWLCEPGIAPAPVCYPGCATDMDCPAGSRCGDGVSGVRGCYSPTSSIGSACATSSECPNSGYCLDESSWGTPGGTCVTFCNLATQSGCTGASTCVAWGFASGAGSCVPTCDDARPCRPGYACVSTGAGRPNACVSRCSTDAECTDGRACNFVTGRCG